jgi:hypothetical protein
MLAITILIAATGLVLGLRFNVFVLGLLLLLGITSIFTIGSWSGDNLGVAALHLLAMLASLQISYPHWLPDRCTSHRASRADFEPDAKSIFAQLSERAAIR